MVGLWFGIVVGGRVGGLTESANCWISGWLLVSRSAGALPPSITCAVYLTVLSIAGAVRV